MSLVSDWWGFYKFQDEKVVEIAVMKEDLLKTGKKHSVLICFALQPFLLVAPGVSADLSFLNRVHSGRGW